jgi:hypothetical protein
VTEAIGLIHQWTDVLGSHHANARFVELDGEIAAEDRDSGELEPDFKGGKFTKHLRAFLNEATQGSYANFQYGDQGELLYDIDVEQDGDKVVITTDDLPIAPITKLLMNNGAKIEVYSAHDHKSKYGRQTFEE